MEQRLVTTAKSKQNGPNSNWISRDERCSK